MQEEGMGIVLSILLRNALSVLYPHPHRRKSMQLAAQTHSFALT